eukprot:scaffold9972_cov118-Isochrysis_galbana.AAC.4
MTPRLPCVCARLAASSSDWGMRWAALRTRGDTAPACLGAPPLTLSRRACFTATPARPRP